VKVGKKFFKQKAGIPQGSILSSLLCNLFYAELEFEHLGFLRSDEGILLRLIDDFLLITTNKNHAQLFLQTMHDGIEEYGVKVNPAKSLVNFEATVKGERIAHCSTAFPYCGNLINTRTLEITKDRDRRKESGNAVCFMNYSTWANSGQYSRTHLLWRCQEYPARPSIERH